MGGRRNYGVLMRKDTGASKVSKAKPNANTGRTKTFNGALPRVIIDLA